MYVTQTNRIAALTNTNQHQGLPWSPYAASRIRVINTLLPNGMPIPRYRNPCVKTRLVFTSYRSKDTPNTL